MDGRLPGHVPLVVATRGDAVESVYYGSIAVVDVAGKAVAGVGDRDFPMFARSTLKPFQALPFVIDGGPAHFGFAAEETALLCSSHSGEPRHVSAVADMLVRIGCNPGQLQCGTHVPLFYAATGTPPPADLALSPLHHNCSGKHAGFLAWCRQHGASIKDYLDPGHPLQRVIRHTLGELLGVGEAGIVMGTDGCSAPTYAVPLPALAYGYAQLAGARAGTPYGDGLAALFKAMTGHPEMVSGEGRGDLVLMKAVPGDWVAKAGADGVQAVGIGSRGLGIAIKIADGSPRAVQVAVHSVLEQLDLLPAGYGGALQAWGAGEIRNHAGRCTGRFVPVFKLDPV